MFKCIKILIESRIEIPRKQPAMEFPWNSCVPAMFYSLIFRGFGLISVLMSVALHIIMWIVLFGALLVIPLGVPGTFIIAGTVLLEAILTDFAVVHSNLLIWLFAIAVALEGVEYLVTGISAQRYGASKIGIVGAILGALIGAIVGSALIPIIGTLIGTLAGAYIGAVGVEMFRTSSVEKALRAGYGAFLGNAGGKIAKMVGGVFMIVLVIRAFVGA